MKSTFRQLLWFMLLALLAFGCDTSPEQPVVKLSVPVYQLESLENESVIALTETPEFQAIRWFPWEDKTLWYRVYHQVEAAALASPDDWYTNRVYIRLSMVLTMEDWRPIEARYWQIAEENPESSIAQLNAAHTTWGQRAIDYAWRALQIDETLGPAYLVVARNWVNPTAAMSDEDLKIKFGSVEKLLLTYRSYYPDRPGDILGFHRNGNLALWQALFPGEDLSTAISQAIETYEKPRGLKAYTDAMEYSWTLLSRLYKDQPERFQAALVRDVETLRQAYDDNPHYYLAITLAFGYDQQGDAGKKSRDALWDTILANQKWQCYGYAHHIRDRRYIHEFQEFGSNRPDDMTVEQARHKWRQIQAWRDECPWSFGNTHADLAVRLLHHFSDEELEEALSQLRGREDREYPLFEPWSGKLSYNLWVLAALERGDDFGASADTVITKLWEWDAKVQRWTNDHDRQQAYLLELSFRDLMTEYLGVESQLLWVAVLEADVLTSVGRREEARDVLRENRNRSMHVMAHENLFRYRQTMAAYFGAIARAAKTLEDALAACLLADKYNLLPERGGHDPRIPRELAALRQEMGLPEGYIPKPHETVGWGSWARWMYDRSRTVVFDERSQWDWPKEKPSVSDLTDLGTLNGSTLSFENKVTIVDIWTTWCQGCVTMLTRANVLAEKLAGHPNLQVVLLNDGQSGAYIRSFLSDLGLDHLEIVLGGDWVQTVRRESGGVLRGVVPQALIVIDRGGVFEVVAHRAGFDSSSTPEAWAESKVGLMTELWEAEEKRRKRQ